MADTNNSTDITPNFREGIWAYDPVLGKTFKVKGTSATGALNVNATASLAGSSIPIAGATTAVGVAIVDGSGNQITSFGGGTQYVDGGTVPTHPAAPTLVYDAAGTWQHVSAANPLPVSATFSGSIASAPTFAQNPGAGTPTPAYGLIDSSFRPQVSVATALPAGSNAIGSITNTSFIATSGTAANLKAQVTGAGTAGTADAGVITVQGITGMTPLKVDGSGVTQPISGTVTANAGTGNFTVVNAGTFAVQATLSAETTKVIGTVNQGTSPWVVSGTFFQATQPVSGTVTVTQATGTNLHTVVDSGTVTANAGTGNFTVINSGTFAVQNTASTPAGTNVIGHVITDTGSTTAVTGTVAVTQSGTWTNTVTQATAANLNATVVGTGTFAVQNTAATPAGTNVIGKVSIDQTTPGTTNKVDIADSLNNPVSAFPATFLRTTDEPHQVFYDPFDSTLDTTNRWTSTQGSSGVAASNTTGVMSMGTGTTANGYSKLTSQPSFTLPIPAWLGVSDAIAIPDLAAPTANSYRFWGVGTTPGTPTTTTPVTDGVGFELSTAGKMFAVVYAGGTRTAVQDLSAATGNSTQPTDANSHRYICYIRTDKAYWYIDGLTSANLVATSNFQSPQVQTLPRLFLAVGAATPPASNSQITCTGATAWDTGKNAVQNADGTFPWRKQNVDKAGAALTSQSIRANKVQQQTTITSSTAETTVFTAVASTFLDVYGVIVTNSSATACVVTFRDATAGTVRFVISVPAGDTRGFMLSESSAYPQAAVNNNWTAQCGTSVAAILVTMMAVKNT